MFRDTLPLVQDPYWGDSHWTGWSQTGVCEFETKDCPYRMWKWWKWRRSCLHFIPKNRVLWLSFSTRKLEETAKQDRVILQAIPIGLIILVLFFSSSEIWYSQFWFWWKVTFTTSFLIGLIASVSSCLAVVGWLVLSLSATVWQDAVSDKKNFTLFHTGRIFGFALLGEY